MIAQPELEADELKAAEEQDPSVMILDEVKDNKDEALPEVKADEKEQPTEAAVEV